MAASGGLPARTTSGLPGRPTEQTNLADILERVLDKGIVIAGDIQINLLDIELLTIKLRLLIASVDRAREMGINWWEGDDSLQRLGPGGEGDDRPLVEQARDLRRRLAELESRIGDEEDGDGDGESSGSSSSPPRPGRAVADELERWARDRAPELLARAEAEAVAVLRDALVRAATGKPGAARAEAPPPPAPARASERPAADAAPPPETGSLLWAYGVVRAAAPVPDELDGVAGDAPVTRVEAAGLAVLVSPVPRADFDAEPLRRNLNDLAWLEHVARAHEATLERVLAATTVVPLRLCTLFEDEDGVRRMLERESGPFAEALDRLAGCEEWALKLLVDPDRLAAAAQGRDDGPAEAEDTASGEGTAYMLRRRAERGARERASALAADVGDDAHARLCERALDAVRHPAQNRDLSGHEGEMLLNGAYLVEAGRDGDLRAVARDLEERHAALGARVEVTGPWPPYNFVPQAGTARIA